MPRYTERDHLRDVMRDVDRITNEATRSTQEHIRRMQDHVDRTTTWAELRTGDGRVLARRWTSELDTATRDRQRREVTLQAERAKRQRREEAELMVGSRVPTWMVIHHTKSLCCGRGILAMRDAGAAGAGHGSCSRAKGHDGRHVFSMVGKYVEGIADRLDVEPENSTRPKTRRPRDTSDTEIDRLIHNLAELGREKKPLKTPNPTGVSKKKPLVRRAAPMTPMAPPKPEPPKVKVGAPCPDMIKLSQGADRCPFAGPKLDDLVCSRPAEHVGDHIATCGDQKGAEVLAFCPAP